MDSKGVTCRYGIKHAAGLFVGVYPVLLAAVLINYAIITGCRRLSPNHGLERAGSLQTISTFLDFVRQNTRWKLYEKDNYNEIWSKQSKQYLEEYSVFILSLHIILAS